MCIDSNIYSNQPLQVSYFSGQASIHYFLRQFNKQNVFLRKEGKAILKFRGLKNDF